MMGTLSTKKSTGAVHSLRRACELLSDKKKRKQSSSFNNPFVRKLFLFITVELLTSNVGTILSILSLAGQTWRAWLVQSYRSACVRVTEMILQTTLLHRLALLLIEDPRICIAQCYTIGGCFPWP
jgi:hypothetical protein